MIDLMLFPIGVAMAAGLLVTRRTGDSDLGVLIGTAAGCVVAIIGAVLQ